MNISMPMILDSDMTHLKFVFTSLFEEGIIVLTLKQGRSTFEPECCVEIIELLLAGFPSGNDVVDSDTC